MNRQLFNAMAAQYATRSVSGNGLVSWEGGKMCVVPSVKLYGAAVQDGTPGPDAPVMPVCNNGLFRATDADGAWSGGQARAPELRAIPGTEYRDEWDCQTGKGIRRVLAFDALDPRFVMSVWATSVSENSIGVYFKSYELLGTYGHPNIINRVGVCSHCGVFGMPSLAQTNFVWDVNAGADPPYVAMRIPVISTADIGPWLQARADAGTPVRFWLALNNPQPFYSPPARLTQPRGYGQIIQTSGDVAGCPITAKYLTH